MNTLRIGISACFLHPDPTRQACKGKTLLYMEQSLAHWVMSSGATAFLLPSVVPPATLAHLLNHVDGLVLHGGADMAPQSYGETPLQPEWAGDAVRDAYELELFRECMARDKPVLGICRGAQLINVGLGGSLYQDIASQCPGAGLHRDADVYENHHHDLAIVPNSGLAQLYGGRLTARINSVHHQAAHRLGTGLVVEARASDGVVEALRLVQKASPAPYVFGVQWHPEFHRDASLLVSQPLLNEFLNAAQARR